VANSLNLQRNGAVGFIDWLDLLCQLDSSSINYSEKVELRTKRCVERHVVTVHLIGLPLVG
jgi:hypothetical protein